MYVWQATSNEKAGRALCLGTLAILGLLAGLGSAVADNLAYQLPYAEDFEAPLSAGTPIGEVGAWQADPLDASMVAAGSYVFDETRRPIVPSADAQVLQLETGFGGATNFFDVPDADQVVYLDSMLKLLPRDSIPASATNDPSVQLFFFLNASSNLVVYHGGVDGASPGTAALPVNPLATNLWNRYTVTLDYVNGDAGAVDRKYFKIQLNGADLASTQAYSAPGQTGAYDGGAWFFTADQTGPDSFGSVAFEGTGGLDDLVVTTHVPLYTTSQVYYAVSDLTGQGSVSPADWIPVVEGASTQIVYQADSWHEIAAFLQNGVAVPAAVGSQVYTSVLENVQADVTNVVQFSESVAGTDGKTPATWYGPLGANPMLSDEDGDGLTLYQEYLLNSDPAVSNALVLFQSGTNALGWASLDLPNGRVIPEVSTNLVLGGWWPLGGYLARDGADTIWHFPEDIPEEPFFLKVNVSE